MGIEAPRLACVLLFLFIWLWHPAYHSNPVASVPFYFLLLPVHVKAQQNHKKTRIFEGCRACKCTNFIHTYITHTLVCVL